MGYVKRVGDCSALFAAGAASMFLLRQFMQYDFTEKAEGITEKLKYFFSDEVRKNYKFYLLMIALLLLSFIVSTALHKFPYIPMAVSALPLIQIVIMADINSIYERPMVYTVLAIVHFIGCLHECVRRDREDSGRRSAIGADLLALVILAFCALTLHMSKNTAEIEPKNISAFELVIYNGFTYNTPDMWAFKYGAAIFPTLVAIRLIHRDLYYIDGILSIAPLVGAFIYWGGDSYTIFAPVLVCLCALYAIARITVTFCCKARIKSPQKAKTEKAEPQN